MWNTIDLSTNLTPRSRESEQYPEGFIQNRLDANYFPDTINSTVFKESVWEMIDAWWGLVLSKNPEHYSGSLWRIFLIVSDWWKSIMPDIQASRNTQTISERQVLNMVAHAERLCRYGTDCDQLGELMTHFFFFPKSAYMDGGFTESGESFSTNTPLSLAEMLEEVFLDFQQAMRDDCSFQINGIQTIEDTAVIQPYYETAPNKKVRLYDGVYRCLLVAIMHDFSVHTPVRTVRDHSIKTCSVRMEPDGSIVFSNPINESVYQALANRPIKRNLSDSWSQFHSGTPTSTLDFAYHLLQVTSSGHMFQRIVKKPNTKGDSYVYELKLSLAWLSSLETKQKNESQQSPERTGSENVTENSRGMVDALLAWKNKFTQRAGKVWQPLPMESKSVFTTPLPTEGTDLDVLMRTIQQHMLPYHLGNPDPRFFGWIMWWGNEIWALAHYIAAMMNPNAAVGNSVARYVEKQVIDWCKDMFLFPKDSVGILTSGGSLANQTPLMAAVDRYKKLHPGKRIRVYVSSQAHGSSQKWIQLQIGEEDIVKIPTWPDFKMDTAILEQQIQDDLQQGYIPAIIIGSMGTTNTGAIDDLEALTRLKNEHSLWLHVDGAYGAPAVGISDQFSHLKPLFAQFDSLAVDFHKLLNVNYSVGLSLVKDPTVLYDAYGVNGQHYLNATNPDGISGWPRTKDDASLELTGPFSRSLSIWIIFQSLGRNGLVDMIDHQLKMAKYMEERIKEKCGHIVEIVTPRTLTVVCFSLKRGLDGDTSEQAISQANARMQELFEQRGNAIPSTTVLNGRTIIRACVSNHMTQKSDIDTLVDEILEINAELTESSS